MKPVIKSIDEPRFYRLMGESEIGKRWLQWHRANPEFYALFERFCFEAIERGKTRLSGWLVANRIRWETSVVTQGDDFKINNDFVALFTRLFAVRHPQYQWFFKLKASKRLDSDILLRELQHRPAVNCETWADPSALGSRGK